MSPAETPASSGRLRVALVITVLAALFYASISFRPPGPLHADEAVQWSLAKELSEGTPYSTHQDKFHGPTLATVVLVAATIKDVLPMEMSEHFLRSVPALFLGLMAAAALILPGLGRGPRFVTAAFCVLTGGCTPFGYYFVQEMLLVAAFVWGVALWLRSEAQASPQLLRALSGVAFGFTLACKVTAVAYLGCFLLALILLRRCPAWRAWAPLAGGLVLSWACFQSVGFTDLPGLVSWWHQLARALGVASGHSEDTLLVASLLPWGLVAGWLLVFMWARAGWSPSNWRTPRGGDLPLILAVLVFAFHLILPYKTPWLLLLVISLPLVLGLPYLLAESTRRAPWTVILLTLLAVALVEPLSGHSRTAELQSFNDGVARVAKAYRGKFYIAVEGGHYWPLPYYLRQYSVGFGEFPQAAQAPLRLLPATDTSEPLIPGYVVSRLTLRAGGDAYWVLVAKGYESVFIRP